MKTKVHEFSSLLGTICKTGIETRLAVIDWVNMQMTGENLLNCIDFFGSEACQ